MKITLCGSTRYMGVFHKANLLLTLAGHAVYSVATSVHGESVKITDEQKIVLDKVHKLKIDHSDAVVILDMDNYVGVSTRSELQHAIDKGKEIFRLSSYGWELERLVDHINKLEEYGS